MARSLLQASKEDFITPTSSEVLDFEDETLRGRGKKNTCNHVTVDIISREIQSTGQSSRKVASRWERFRRGSAGSCIIQQLRPLMEFILLFFKFGFV